MVVVRGHAAPRLARGAASSATTTCSRSCPKTNPDIQVFNDVEPRFGGLDVALVGVAADDALAPEFLGKLRRATKQLNETKGVDYALSLANVEDFTPDPEKGGIGVDYLIPAELP